MNTHLILHALKIIGLPPEFKNKQRPDFFAVVDPAVEMVVGKFFHEFVIEKSVAVP